MQKSEKNYWPYAIIISIFLIAVACAATVYIAIKNAPVELDTFYFDSYGNVDKNINEIKAMQKVFEEKYTLSFNELNTLHVKKDNQISLQLKDKKTNDFIKNANIKILLTRPDTNKFNVELLAKSNNDKYLSPLVEISKVGRWLIQVKVEVGDDTGFFTQEVYVDN